MQPLDIIILTLATWRITSLIATERGPYAIFEKFRNRLGITTTAIPESEAGKLFSCIMCLSIWVAFVAVGAYCALGRDVVFWLSLPLALSAGAIIVDRVVG